MRLTADEASRRFRAARVARLATVGAAGAPHLVPVTFAVIDRPASLVVFAVDHKPKSTTALRRLANIAAEPRVAFLADGYDDDWDRLWWVRADAVAGVVDGDLRSAAIGALVGKYGQYRAMPPDGVVVGARVLTWSGWQAATEG